MSLRSAIDAAWTRFSTEFSTAQPTVPYGLENRVTNQPDPNPTKPLTSAYVLMTYRPVFTRPIGSAGDDWHAGILAFQVTTALKIGLATALDIAESVRAIFRNTNVGGVIYVGADGGQPEIDVIGLNPDRTGFLVMVNVPFQFFD